jgi:hypothetical protein
LPASCAHDPTGSRLSLEFVNQRCLAYAGFSCYENNLPLPPNSSPNMLPQVTEGTTSPHYYALSLSRWLGGFGNVVPDRSDKLIPAPRQSLNKNRIFGAIAEYSPNVEDVPLENVRLNMSFGPNAVKKFVLRNQASRMVHEISQNGVRLRL